MAILVQIIIRVNMVKRRIHSRLSLHSRVPNISVGEKICVNLIKVKEKVSWKKMKNLKNAVSNKF